MAHRFLHCEQGSTTTRSMQSPREHFALQQMRDFVALKLTCRGVGWVCSQTVARDPPWFWTNTQKISDISSTYVPVCRWRHSRHRATRGAISAQRPLPFWVSLIKEGKELALRHSQGFADDGMPTYWPAILPGSGLDYQQALGCQWRWLRVLKCK
jgi:hypothetical protein